MAWYTGQPYSTAGFREKLVNALGDGLHCLIISGGYGLVRPEEPIHFYKAHLPTQTQGVWSKRLPTLLDDYTKRNDIRRTFSAFSASYAAHVPRKVSTESWRAIPEFDRQIDRGSPMRVVPEKVGALLTSLMCDDFDPGEGWVLA